MKTLFKVALALVSSQFLACTVVDGLGDGLPSGEFELFVDFELESSSARNVVPVDGDHIRMTVRERSAAEGATSLIAPQETSITLPNLASGTYELSFQYLNDRGLPESQIAEWVLVGESDVQTVTIAGADEEIEVDIVVNQGFWKVTMAFEDASGNPASCADFPTAVGVQLDFSAWDTIPGVTPDEGSYVFPCAEVEYPNFAFSPPTNISYYNITTRLVDASGQTLATEMEFTSGEPGILNLPWGNVYTPTVYLGVDTQPFVLTATP